MLGTQSRPPLKGLVPSAALNVANVGSGHAALMSLQRVLAALDMTAGPPLHLLPVVAGVFHILFAKLANHLAPPSSLRAERQAAGGVPTAES
jgi:hypothetical protein